MEYLFAAGAVLVAFLLFTTLAVFIREVRKRYRQCGSLIRALLESHVTTPLGEYEVVLFGTLPSRLRIFKEGDEMDAPASVTFETRRRVFFAYDRYEYAVPREELPELVRLLRKAADARV